MYNPAARRASDTVTSGGGQIIPKPPNNSMGGGGGGGGAPVSMYKSPVSSHSAPASSPGSPLHQAKQSGFNSEAFPMGQSVEESRRLQQQLQLTAMQHLIAKKQAQQYSDTRTPSPSFHPFLPRFPASSTSSTQQTPNTPSSVPAFRACGARRGSKPSSIRTPGRPRLHSTL